MGQSHHDKRIASISDLGVDSSLDSNIENQRMSHIPSAGSEHWSGTGRLRGGRSGIWFFITALRILGLRLTYALLPPVAAYFSFASPDVEATMDYHRRV